MDVVLGMDWLSANASYIGCKEKAIYIPKESTTPKEVIYEFLERMINMIPCLYYEGWCFLFLFTMELEGGNATSSMPVVCEFLDVFPEDDTSLPLERELNFSIDLVLWTTLVSIAPYRMPPAELRGLKMQLEELLEKHFIQPSVSPWGAPILLVKNKDGSMRLCIEYS